MTVTARSLSLDHLALPARDAAATLDFYSGVLGLRLEAAFEGDDWGGHPWLMMVFGLKDGRQIALCVLDGAPTPLDLSQSDDLPHFAFAVPDEAALNAWRARLHEAGVDFRDEDHETQQSIYFSDPAGLVWEITAPPSRGLAAGDEYTDPQDVVRAWIADRARGRRRKPRQRTSRA